MSAETEIRPCWGAARVHAKDAETVDRMEALAFTGEDIWQLSLARMPQSSS
jgi:hypothetical protein